MGLTQFSVDLVSKYLPVYSVCELGTQQIYTADRYGVYANVFYQDKGVSKYNCIDINWLNNSLYYDLSELIEGSGLQFDIVTDFGTSEHVCNLHNCWANKVNLCKPNGLIISENPKEGSWFEHGFHYMTIEKVKAIGIEHGLVLVDIGEVAAMDNNKDGWNIWSVFRKP